jgi:hypothetical protein
MPEQRKRLRLPIESITFIELVSPGMDQSDAGKMVTCKSLDVSRRGLQVILEEEITVDTILQIGIDLPDTEDILYLVGEVRWCRPDKDKENSWVGGFQILNANNSDIERWMNLVSGLEN